MIVLKLLFEAVIFALALNLDALVSAFAYGASKIKVYIRCMITIDCMCTLLLAAALIFGKFLQRYIPAGAAELASGCILMVLGFYKLFSELIKSRKKKRIFPLRKKPGSPGFLIGLLYESTYADANADRKLSVRESLALGLALSVDGLAAGFSAGLAGLNPLVTSAISFFICFTALYFGVKLGRITAAKLHTRLDWLSGVLLVALSVIKFLD